MQCFDDLFVLEVQDWGEDLYKLVKWSTYKNTRAVSEVRGSFLQLITDAVRHSLCMPWLPPQSYVKQFDKRQLHPELFWEDAVKLGLNSGEHSEDNSPLGLFQNIHSFSVSHTLQAVSVHSNDLIATFQPAVFNGCPLQERQKPVTAFSPELTITTNLTSFMVS